MIWSVSDNDKSCFCNNNNYLESLYNNCNQFLSISFSNHSMYERVKTKKRIKQAVLLSFGSYTFTNIVNDFTSTEQLLPSKTMSFKPINSVESCSKKSSTYNNTPNILTRGQMAHGSSYHNS
jgi:hypothetical protein